VIGIVPIRGVGRSPILSPVAVHGRKDIIHADRYLRDAERLLDELELGVEIIDFVSAEETQLDSISQAYSQHSVRDNLLITHVRVNIVRHGNIPIISHQQNLCRLVGQHVGIRCAQHSQGLERSRVQHA